MGDETLGSPSYPSSDLQQGPFKLKKLTVRLPPPEILQNSDPGLRWLLESDVQKQIILNEVVDAQTWNNVATHKGFVKVNDRLDKVNGRVGKSEDKLKEYDALKKAREERENQRARDAVNLAKDLVQRKKEDAIYRDRVFGYLKWIVGLVILAGGSQFVTWLTSSTTAVKAVLIIGTMGVALLIGIFYGRQRPDPPPTIPEGD